MAQATAFQLHEAYMEQAWRTMKDSILLKMTYNTDGTKIKETPDEFRQRTAQRSALEGKHGLKAQQRAQQEASLQQPSDPVARQIAGTAAPAPAAPTNVDVSSAQMISAPAPAPYSSSLGDTPGVNMGGFTGVKNMNMVAPPSPGQRVENKINEMRARLPAAPEARTDPAPVGPTPANYAHQDSKGQVQVASPTSTVGSPAAAQTTPGSGVGPNSTGATCGSCGMMTGGGACGNTACATNAGKGLFGLNNQQGGGQVGVQQPNATNQNPEEPGAGVPEQRSMEQKIRDITATAEKNFTEDMGFGQRVATAGKQAVNNLRGEDGTLQTGLGLRMMPQKRYRMSTDSSFQNPTGWWGEPVAAA